MNKWNLESTQSFPWPDFPSKHQEFILEIQNSSQDLGFSSQDPEFLLKRKNDLFKI